MLLPRRESFEGGNVTGRAKGGPAARDEEGYRGTVVVCGKSVHIIRRNRKEEILVGIRRGERRGRYYLQREHIQREDFERIDERLKGKYEVWKFGLGPPHTETKGHGGRGWSVDVPFRILAKRRWKGVIMCGCRELRPFHVATDIKLLRRRSRLELTREDCLDHVFYGLSNCKLSARQIHF